MTISSSFFEELKRRNVVKVTVLYVVAAWLLLQITDVLSSLLPVPEWTGSFVFILLVVGLPPALIFAWIYEFTPEGLRRQTDVDRNQSITHETGHKINVLIIGLLVLAIGVVVVDRLIPETQPVVEVPVADVAQDAEPIDRTATDVEASLSAPENSVAVLPFVNMSSDAEQEYFSDGLSEELLNLLAKVPELRVAARTSSFSLKGQNLQISEVGDVLKVAHVLEGSVRKSGDRLRITVQLIHAEDGYHLWSETYDRTLDDIFAIQDEIASEVVAELKVALLGEAPKARDTDTEAYLIFLQARHMNQIRSADGYAQALKLYQQVLAIDPQYTSAWSGLASTYLGQANLAERPIQEGLELAHEAAARALAIDPDSAAAHAQMGRLADVYGGDLAEAARHFERALALEPSDPEILRQVAAFLFGIGRLDEAIELLNYVAVRDPINALAHRSLGLAYEYAGQMDNSITSLRTALNLNPAAFGAHSLLGRALLLNGQPTEALAIISEEPSDYAMLELPLAYYALGRIEESDAALAELVEKYADHALYNIAAIHAYRDEPDEAFAWLEKAYAYRDAGLSEIVSDPLLANIQDDPRLQSFLERIGRSPQQLAAIEFEADLPQ
jgi:TolB-like protein/Tfp pilus assembly protein PilF